MNKYLWLRLFHRKGFHQWTEWEEIFYDPKGKPSFMYRYCKGCRVVEWGKV